jgi:diguanylate cyclase (GGDEF)-like protein/PAS domain S-box-containing protein
MRCAIKKTDNELKQAAILRQRAEEIARGKAAPPPENLDALHELQVHQIELEMQNEELRRAQTELETARARYFDLYNLAPVGYLTIGEKGLIQETNLSVAGMLEVARGALVNQLITRFIHEEDQDIYYRHRKQLFESGETQNCDLRMMKKNGTPFWAHMAATAAQDANGAQVCCAVLSDISERKHAEAALREINGNMREAKDHFEAIFNTGPGAAVITRARDGMIVDINEGFTALSGYTREESIGKSSLVVDLWKNPADRQRIVKELGEKGFCENFEAPFQLKDGSEISGVMSARMMMLQGVPHIISVTHDITERKKVETALRESEEKYRMLFESAGDAIFIHDPQEQILAVNHLAIERLGYTHAELLVMKASQVDSAAEGQHTKDRVSRLMEQGHLSFETVHQRKDGTFVPTEVKSQRITWDGQPAIMSICRDITTRKEAEEKTQALNVELERLAMTDFLTNLFNRRYFMQRSVDEFKRAHRNGQPLAMLMLDIDHFKKVNDAFGHEAGDLALQQVAAALKSSVREIDMLGRMGGEEFAVLLPNTLLPDAALLGERIRLSITNLSLQTAGGALIGTITISVGAAAFSAEMASIDDLLRNADTAMYHAKNSGRNRVEMY